ncbi:MAG: signal peptidase II [Chloroflexota bacterium]|nr:signal peptidase II [Chloroflexota bacterium]
MRATTGALPKWFAGPIGLAVLGVDQFTKSWVGSAFGPGQERRGVAMLGDLLEVRYVENRGAAFGMLRGEAMILSLLAISLTVGLLIYFWRLEGAPVATIAGVGLIAGGAVGNLADRLRMGFVVDFISVGAWPTFNLADSAITIGVASLAFSLLRDERPRPARSRDVGSGAITRSGRSVDG